MDGAPQAPPPITLVDCLRKLGAKEQVSVHDTWFCSKCKERRPCLTQKDLWSTPEILIFQLKRAASTFDPLFGSIPIKRDDLVDFPLSGLDLSEFVAGHKDGTPLLYDLFAVTVRQSVRLLFILVQRWWGSVSLANKGYGGGGLTRTWHDRTMLVTRTAATTMRTERTSGLAIGTISTTMTSPAPISVALCHGTLTSCSIDDDGWARRVD